MSFLNEFSSTCEEKFDKVSRRISDLEVMLELFEAKLNCISCDNNQNSDYQKTSNDQRSDNQIDRGYRVKDNDGGTGDPHGGHSKLEESTVANIYSGNITEITEITEDTNFGAASSTHRSSSSSSRTSNNFSPPQPPPPPPPPFHSLSHLCSPPEGGGGGGRGDGEGGGGGGVKAKDHPDYAGFFKMMRVSGLPFVASNNFQ